MSELRDLYQEVILDHGKRPRNHGALCDADGRAEGKNPLCGDHLTVYVKTVDGTIDEVRFEGSGCAISVASASMMTEAMRGKTIDEMRETFEAFSQLVTGRQGEADVALGKLVVFGGVSQFPMRVKCATLPWHTLRAALEHQNESVTTE